MTEARDKPSAAPFAGKRIWVTRPAKRADHIGAEIKARGGEYLHLPLLEIHPVPVTEAMMAKVRELDRYDGLVYISTNAARLGLELFSDFWPQYPAHIRNFTVGPTTAQVLEDQGLSVIYPRGETTSEALLALPEVDAVAGRRVLLVKGVGGREFLAEELLGRGCKVDTLELYRREPPYYESDYLRDCLSSGKPDVVVITSGEALANFVQIFQGVWPEVRAAHLLVSSRRLKDVAREQDFVSVSVMRGASDEAVIEGLEQYFGQQQDD